MLLKLGDDGVVDKMDEEDLVYVNQNDLEKLIEENDQLKKDRNDMFIRERDAENKWREVKKENEQLKIQLQNTSDQRDEFGKSARENANRVGQLKKENEQLKSELQTKELRVNVLNSMNNSLKEENIQLKCELEDFKKFVYSFKNITDLTNWKQYYEDKELYND